MYDAYGIYSFELYAQLSSHQRVWFFREQDYSNATNKGFTIVELAAVIECSTCTKGAIVIWKKHCASK